MKTIKLVLPVFAFLFAVVAALASSSFARVDGYQQNDPNDLTNCTKIGSCNETGSVQCVSSAATGSIPLYKKSGATCGTVLNGNTFQ